jgi:hypothetical protein
MEVNMSYCYRITAKWIVFLIFLSVVACTPVAVEPGAVGDLTYPDPNPLPTLNVTSPPLPTTAVLQPEETYIEEMPDPWPTFTPRPIPTVRPGATATPIPLQGPAESAAGTILYTSGELPITKLAIDVTGSSDHQTRPLSTSLNFNPILGPSSPDGRYLALLRPLEIAGIPYIFDMLSEEARPLFQEHPLGQHMSGIIYDWHPDGRKVLFWFFNNEELWLVDVFTEEHTVLALTEGPVQGAAVSPDGQNVAFVGRSDNQEVIYTVSTAGGNAQSLMSSSEIKYLFGWSPDGLHILYGSGANQSKLDDINSVASSGGSLRIMNVATQDHRPLSGPYVLGWGFRAVWSPDGNWIAFTGHDVDHTFGCIQQGTEPDWDSCRFVGTGVYVENVMTGELRRLSSGIEPAWSPDGMFVALISNQSGAPEIWQIRLDGADLKQLTSDNASKRQIIWMTEKR